MDKKTKKIIILTGFFIIVLILIEVIIRFLISTTKKIVEEHNQKVAEEEYKGTVEYEEEVYLEDCIKKAITLMKSGDYETLYSLLNPIYKEYMQFTSIDDFKEYMINYIGDPTSIELIQYDENNGKYVCTFEINNDVASNTRKILIEENTEDDIYNFNIIFDEIYYIKTYDTNLQKSSNGINYQMAYGLGYSDYFVYIINITNQNKKPINLSLSDTYISKTNKKEYYSNDLEVISNINIDAGETKKIAFKIYDGDSNMYEDSYICIKPKIDGKIDTNETIIVMRPDYF